MSVMSSFTLRSLAKNRVRTAVTIAGVALAAALLTAVLTSLTSLSNFMYQSEVQTGGTWQASVWTQDESALNAARTNEHVTNLTVVRDVGFAAVPAAQQNSKGPLLAFVSVDDSFEPLCAPRLEENFTGRMPKQADEVVLPASWRSMSAFGNNDIQLDTTITLDMGERECIAANDHEEDAESPSDYLNSGSAYLDSATGQPAYERIAHAQTRSFTVTGFYSQVPFGAMTGLGPAAILSEDAPHAAHESSLAYIGTTGFATTAEIEAFVKDTFGEACQHTLNLTLLRYQGISDERAIWNTFYQIAAVLAAVVIVACVSLIYNAFAISVAQRTRQFGLLASIGASHAQIRHAVLFESLLVAAVGIPLGIGLGVAGSAAVLNALAPSIQAILDENVSFTVSVDWRALLVAAALALATVLVSAWIPARKAARTSAIDALHRTADLPAGKHASRTQRTVQQAYAKLWKPQGIDFASRCFGIGGMMAKRSVKRGNSKGRAAIVSLALAVVLLMTAGTFSTYMNTATSVMGETSESDLTVYASVESDTTPDSLEATYQKLCEAQGVQPLGWLAWGSPIALIVPHDMASEGLTSANQSYATQDNQVVSSGYVNFIEDSAYRAFLESQGIDPAAFMDPAHPRVVVAGKLYGQTEESYTLLESLKSTGTVQAFLQEPQLEGKQFIGFFPGENGPCAQFVNAEAAGEYSGVEADPESVSAETLANQAQSLEIGALVDEMPAMLGNSDTLCIMAPACFLKTGFAPAAEHDLGFRGSFTTEDHVAAAEALTAAATQEFGENTAEVQDLVQGEEGMRLLSQVVNVFTLAFSGILTLIAVANVFNTLTNGLILRRREFAVMRSLGMGEATFKRMIAAECLRYGALGLVPGLVVSLGVGSLMFQALGGSIEGLSYTLPWQHMLIACAIVAAAMIASICYGLHCCKSNNVVEALRADAA